MLRRRTIILSLFLLAVIAVFVANHSSGPSHEGRSVEQWFRLYYEKSPTLPHNSPIKSAFKAMGTNAVPFLANRILGDLTPRKRPAWMWKLPTAMRPRSRITEAHAAIQLLVNQVQPPGELLVPLLEPGLNSARADERRIALIALESIGSGKLLARPYLERALKDSDYRINEAAAVVVGQFGQQYGGWAVDGLLHCIDNPQCSLSHSLNALLCLGTNSLSALPELKERLRLETNETRQRMLSNSILTISQRQPKPE